MHRRIAETFFVVFLHHRREEISNVSETMWNQAGNFSHEFFIAIFNKRLKTQTRMEIELRGCTSMHSNGNFNVCEHSLQELWQTISLALRRE